MLKNIVDNLLLEDGLDVCIPENKSAAEKMYRAVENTLKNKYNSLDVFVRIYEEDKLVSISGKFVGIDKNGKYIIIQTESNECDFIHFAGLSEAIVAISNGKLLYENRNVFERGNLRLTSNNDIESTRLQGRFSSCLCPEYGSNGLRKTA
jgi:hypothetical protein